MNVLNVVKRTKTLLCTGHFGSIFVSYFVLKIKLVKTRTFFRDHFQHVRLINFSGTFKVLISTVAIILYCFRHYHPRYRFFTYLFLILDFKRQINAYLYPSETRFVLMKLETELIIHFQQCKETLQFNYNI